MHLHATRPGRPTLRPGLEALEGRVLPSTNLPAPALAPAASQQAAPPQLEHAPAAHLHAAASASPAAQARPALVSYSYRWDVLPGALLLGHNPPTANGKSTGSVAFAAMPAGTAVAT